ncbi:unnamed protein product [Rotaria sp. Silwood2]|nr:unnamed protein product [Rotaria sp. Silwood2]
MLNPSYRSLWQATKEEQTRTQKYLRKRLDDISQSVASSALIHSDSDDDYDNRDYLARYVDNPPISRKQDEVSRYLKFNHRETNTSDILEFWKTMAGFFSSLAKVAFQILTVPATSASMERSFSAAGQVVFERRSNISPDVVDDIVFFYVQSRKTNKRKEHEIK